MLAVKTDLWITVLLTVGRTMRIAHKRNCRERLLRCYYCLRSISRLVDEGCECISAYAGLQCVWCYRTVARNFFI